MYKEEGTFRLRRPGRFFTGHTRAHRRSGQHAQRHASTRRRRTIGVTCAALHRIGQQHHLRDQHCSSASCHHTAPVTPAHAPDAMHKSAY